MFDISEIKFFVSKYNVSKEDVLLLSNLHYKRLPYKKVLFSSEFRKLSKEIREIDKKYKFSFLDIGKCTILFEKAPLISDSNYEEIMTLLTPKEIEEKKRIEANQLREKTKSESEINAKIAEQNRIYELLAPIRIISKEIKKISALKIEELTEFKNSIIENESYIVEKGGDEKLFQFLKVDAFLQDYRNKILVDIEDVISVYNEAELERAILSNDKTDKRSLEYLADSFRNSANILDGGIDRSFEGKMNRLLNSATKLELTINYQVETMLFYNALAFAMLVSFLENKKIRFFEIHSAFEKLGVFDSSWQKNVAAKLDSIDARIATLNNQMIELNNNFIRLAESSEEIVKEIKIGFEKMNIKISANNLISAITAYQVYKISKNTKGLE